MNQAIVDEKNVKRKKFLRCIISIPPLNQYPG
jgi:hypothetical protein